jgi:hypothetical protein
VARSERGARGVTIDPELIEDAHEMGIDGALAHHPNLQLPRTTICF